LVIALEGNDSYAVPGYYAVSCGNFLPTFRDDLSVPFSGFKNPKERKGYINSMHGGIVHYNLEINVE